MNSDIAVELAGAVQGAYQRNRPLRIVGGGSKAFYGNAVDGEPLDVTPHRGIIEYQPSELVLTARAGTPLAEIEQTLADHGQVLAFEPPAHDAAATFGGAIASGLSGPRRAFAGAARDFVLGARIINGRGEILKFGGQVMKNVAGYDASRLMAGAQGTLGVLLDISVKVLPAFRREASLRLRCDEAGAGRMLSDWIRQGLPITASCYHDGELSLRLGNTGNSVRAARQRIGGDDADPALWQQLRQQSHAFFRHDDLWRVSVPAATPALGDMPQLLEWAGALRWVRSPEPLYELAASHGGHATRYDLSAQAGDDIFQPLADNMLALQQRIKRAFDPAGILNPGRIYRAI